jgi:hypothetical protein
VPFPQQAFWHFYNQLELLECPGHHLVLHLEYVRLYVLEVIILNREMKIVSNLLLCQNNIFFNAKNIGALYIFYNQLIFNTYDGNNCFIIPKNILRKIA